MNPTAAPNPTLPDSWRFSIRRPRSLWIGLAAVAVVISGAAVLQFWMRQRLDASSTKLFHDNLARLESGETKILLLFTTRGTDSLLKRVRGMPEVETVVLEHTDVTDAGVQHVATLPRLRRIVVYGGQPGLSDRGLIPLRSCANLETIELYGTPVTEAAIADLKKALPELDAQY